MADEPVAQHEKHHGDEEDAHCYPGDVSLGAPRLDKVRPAVGNVRAVEPALGEDEVLRSAEQEAAHPRGDDHDVGALRGLLQGFQRVADSNVTVQGHHHHHIGGGEHPHHLEVLDDPAEKVWTVEAEGDIPAELRQHLEEGDHQVSQAQVFDEKVHPRHLLLRVVHCQQDAHIPNHSNHEGDAQDHDLYLGHLLVSRVRIGSVRVEGVVSRCLHS